MAHMMLSIGCLAIDNSCTVQSYTTPLEQSHLQRTKSQSDTQRQEPPGVILDMVE